MFLNLQISMFYLIDLDGHSWARICSLVMISSIVGPDELSFACSLNWMIYVLTWDTERNFTITTKKKQQF